MRIGANMQVGGCVWWKKTLDTILYRDMWFLQLLLWTWGWDCKMPMFVLLYAFMNITYCIKSKGCKDVFLLINLKSYLLMFTNLQNHVFGQKNWAPQTHVSLLQIWFQNRRARMRRVSRHSPQTRSPPASLPFPFPVYTSSPASSAAIPRIPSLSRTNMFMFGSHPLNFQRWVRVWVTSYRLWLVLLYQYYKPVTDLCSFSTGQLNLFIVIRCSCSIITVTLSYYCSDGKFFFVLQFFIFVNPDVSLVFITSAMLTMVLVSKGKKQ